MPAQVFKLNWSRSAIILFAFHLNYRNSNTYRSLRFIIITGVNGFVHALNIHAPPQVFYNGGENVGGGGTKGWRMGGEGGKAFILLNTGPRTKESLSLPPQL
jgi:hypothetical protein